MEQLSSGTITFQSYRDSMNSVIQSATNNSEMENNETNFDAIHTINLAIRLTQGEAPPVKRK
jgi:hypothetical protein